MFTVTVSGRFSASHRLREYAGPCSNLHGHNFRVEVDLCGPVLDGQGMLLDFVTVDRALVQVLERFDHHLLNDVSPFDRLNPTAENLSQIIFQRLSEALTLPGDTRISRVTVWETEGYRASYQPG